MENTVKYFDKPGPENTDEVLSAVSKRAEELQINDIVLATRLGNTALQAGEFFKYSNFNIFAITHQYGYAKSGKWFISDEIYNKINLLGVKIATATMPFSTMGKLFRPDWKPQQYPIYNTMFPYDIIADTLRMFSQGMKVCVEIVVMAADMGLIPIEKEIISIAGTNRGADTAVVIKPAHIHRIYDLRILEIIAMPRLKYSLK